WTLLTKAAPSDAFEYSPHQGYRITYEDASAVIELLAHMASDWRIYNLIEAIVESAIGSTAEIKRPQRAELIRRLDSLIETKFPAPGSIEHDGYKIIARAQVNRLRLPGDALDPDG